MTESGTFNTSSSFESPWPREPKTVLATDTNKHHKLHHTEKQNTNINTDTIMIIFNVHSNK